MLSAERCGMGFLPGPAVCQPPCLVGPAQAAPTSRLCPAHTPGPAAPLPGSSGWSVVSTGVTNASTNFLWSQAQDPSPPCRRGQRVQAPRKDVARVLRRFRDARPTLGLGVIAQLAKGKEKFSPCQKA